MKFFEKFGSISALKDYRLNGSGISGHGYGVEPEDGEDDDENGSGSGEN